MSSVSPVIHFESAEAKKIATGTDFHLDTKTDALLVGGFNFPLTDVA